TLDSLLTSIIDSVKSASVSLDNLSAYIDETSEVPEIVKSLIDGKSNENLEGVSLLSLKNASMLSYINNLGLILGSKLDSYNTKDSEKIKQIKDKAVESTVVQRVTLDRGVKSLEKKVNYQLEKLVNAYQRREKEQEDVVEKAKSKAKGSDDDDDNDDSEDDSEDEDDALTYRPDPSALLQKKSTKQNGDEEETEATATKYRPPKISAMLPPTSMSDPDKQSSSEKKQRNLQSMDEYLQSISDAPMVENSVGATIINKGRDMKSAKQLAKEAEIKRYEEENFTRLPNAQTKMSFKEKKRKARDEFMGEDWSMFNNDREFTGDKDGGVKKRKRVSAWERAKKR
ncbi:hypothetical protein CANARDRAFT_182888, partial [[Candida] arabinofermentans NRRL YB-2248]